MADTTFTQYRLDIVQAVSCQCITRNQLHQTHGGFETFVTAILPDVCDILVLTMVDLFAAENIKNVTMQWPKDWWEAVKERFAPIWFTKRWPVVFQIQIVDVKAIWQGYKPPPSAKYGPYFCCVLEHGNASGTDSVL